KLSGRGAYPFRKHIRYKHGIAWKKDIGVFAGLLQIGIRAVIPECVEITKTVLFRDAGEVLTLLHNVCFPHNHPSHGWHRLQPVFAFSPSCRTDQHSVSDRLHGFVWFHGLTLLAPEGMIGRTIDNKCRTIRKITTITSLSLDLSTLSWVRKVRPARANSTASVTNADATQKTITR